MHDALIPVKIGASVNALWQGDAFFSELDARLDAARQLPAGSMSARQAFYELKPQLYTLCVPLLEHVMQRAIQHKSDRPPYGLVEPDPAGSLPYYAAKGFDPADPFRDLNLKMSFTLLQAQKEVFSELQALAAEAPDRQAPILKAYMGLERIFDFSRGIAQLPYPQQIDPAVFMEGGFITAAAVMSRVLALIPELFPGRDPASPALLAQTARNSFSLLTDLANRHSAGFSALFKLLRRPPTRPDDENWRFDPGAFIVNPHPSGGFAVAIDPLIKQQSEAGIAAIREEHPDSPYMVGCPALYSSATRTLWQWHVEIAETLYAAVPGAPAPASQPAVH